MSLLKSTVMPRPPPGAPELLYVKPVAGLIVSEGSQRTQPKPPGPGVEIMASQTMQFLSTANP